MSVMPVIGGTANDGNDAADTRSLLHHQGKFLVSLQASISKRRWRAPIDGYTLAITDRRTGRRTDLPSIRRSLWDCGGDSTRHRFVVLLKQ